MSTEPYVFVLFFYRCHVRVTCSTFSPRHKIFSSIYFYLRLVLGAIRSCFVGNKPFSSWLAWLFWFAAESS